MRAIGVVPARYGSSRFPGKALAALGGVPMVVRVVGAVAGAETLGEALVATDDERIAQVVRDAGFEAVLTAAGLRSGSDRVWAAARGREADVIVNVQGDEATIRPETIDSCVRPLLEGAEADVVTLRSPVLDADELASPHAVKVVVGSDGCALYFSRCPIPNAEEFSPNLHFRHIGIYAYRRTALRRFAELPTSALERAEKLEQLRGLAAGMRYLVLTTSHRPADVNTPEDLARAQAAMRFEEE